MSDRRITVVAGVLSDHAWVWAVFGCDAEPVCEWTADTDDPELMNHQHDRHVAAMVIAALDADARRRPFIGIVPQVRPLNERDTPGIYPGLDEFHPSTTHRPEAM